MENSGAPIQKSNNFLLGCLHMKRRRQEAAGSKKDQKTLGFHKGTFHSERDQVENNSMGLEMGQ